MHLRPDESIASRNPLHIEPGLQEFIRSLPKAELHLHLEGSVQPETIRELNPSLTLDEIQANFHYTGFAGFLKSYVWVTRTLDSPAAYALATRRLLESLEAQNIRYAEITLSAGVILWKEQRIEPIFEAISSEVRSFGKIAVGWIFDAIRQFGADRAARVFEIAKDLKREGVVAVGIGGDEDRGPATWFHTLYRDARESGLGLTCHAGEVSGPQSVVDAIAIGAQRIGHGIRAIDDQNVVRLLKQTGIPLEICPSSNVCTGAIPSLKDHPLRRLWDAGVTIVLGSDDPALFQTCLLHEYTLAANIFGFNRDELKKLAANSLRYRFFSTAALPDALL